MKRVDSVNCKTEGASNTLPAASTRIGMTSSLFALSLAGSARSSHRRKTGATDTSVLRVTGREVSCWEGRLHPMPKTCPDPCPVTARQLSKYPFAVWDDQESGQPVRQRNS